MIHFKPASFLRALTPVSAPPVMAPARPAHGRADHARMMAYAARRRSAASMPGEDRGYWKTCAPAAVAKAAAMRCEGGFARLP